MSSSAPAPVAVRGFWRQYRAPLIAALPAGVALGAAADLAFSVDTVHTSAQAQIPALLAYAGVGALFALVACIGAALALLVRRHRTATPTSPIPHIAAGAGGAVLIGVLLVGALSAGITDSWGWYSLYVVVAVVTGLVAAIGAGGITAYFQHRHPIKP